MSNTSQLIDLPPQPEKPMSAHLRDGSSQDIVSEQPVRQYSTRHNPFPPCHSFGCTTADPLPHLPQSSKNMSMRAEPQLSLRGGGVIGDW